MKPLDILNIIILAVLLILLIIIACLFFSKNNNYNGEDDYQNNRIKEHAHVHIFTTTYVNENINIEKYINNLNYLLHNLIEDHFKNNAFIKNKILTTYTITEETENEKLIDNVSELWEEINKSPLPILSFKYNTSKRRLTSCKNHQYLGGIFFMKLGSKLTNTSPVNIYTENYTPIISELFMIRFGMFWLSSNNNSKIYKSPSNKINRVNFIFDYSSINFNNKLRRQTIVMTKILNILTSSLTTPKKKINILLPVAFETKTKTYNNVGGIFVDFSYNNSPNLFQKKLISKKYMAHDTNNLSRIVSKGKKVRTNIDCVFTIGCLKSSSSSPSLVEEGGEEKEILENTITSYLSVPDYKIYIVSITIDRKVYTTFTLITDEVDLNILKNNINNDKDIIKSLFDF